MRAPSEILQYGFKVIINRNRHKSEAAAKLARFNAYTSFFATGKSIAGVKLIARWRNPDNKNPLHADWKTTEDAGQSLEDFLKTLHGSTGALRPAAERIDSEREEFLTSDEYQDYLARQKKAKKGWKTRRKNNKKKTTRKKTKKGKKK